MTVHEVAVIGEPVLNRVHDPATPLLLEYFTRYSVIFEPPALAGAFHVTASWVLPRTATTPVGLPGTVAAAGATTGAEYDVGLPGTVAAGVTGAEFDDGRLMPTAFLAITLIT